MSEPLREHLQSVVKRVRARLAMRRVVAGGSVGFVAGLSLSIPLVLGLSRVIPPDSLVLTGLLGSLALTGMLALSAISWQLLRRNLQRNEIAQLLDQALDTEEAWLTASWLVDDTTVPHRDALLAGLEEQLNSPALSEILAIHPPRYLRWTPLLAALWLGAFFVPPGSLALHKADPAAAVVEGERLDQRLTEVAEESNGAPLPDAIEAGLDQLADALVGEELSNEEAVERIEALQEQLESFTEAMEPSSSLLDALERAAEELSTTPELAEALRDADMEKAAEQLEQLASSTEKMSPAEKRALGESMAEAAKELGGSASPEMKELAESMQGAGEQLQQEGQQQAQQRMKELTEQLAKNQALGERLQQDERALERAQKTNAALEGSKRRLGEEPEQKEGTSSQEGGDQKGNESGEGEGQAEGEGRDGASGGEGQGDDGELMQASTGRERHTWEDEGETADEGEGFSDEDRSSDRKASADQHIDDFERLYAGSRLEDVDALLASAKGTVDEQGEIELLPTRRTSSNETADRVLVKVPDSYTEAAREAITNETVPPGYRDAVKQYFDQME